MNKGRNTHAPYTTFTAIANVEEDRSPRSPLHRETQFLLFLPPDAGAQRLNGAGYRNYIQWSRHGLKFLLGLISRTAETS